ncbi:hypothetical protein BG011_001301 [Mortierella polycephala]|uniref:Major facilitator superfamily (MFS) profile domain-containing protein n=1 Tax=Mortierella polycephala TaxID=41804 RepID=A0A9P6PLJ0_9FUNG|nr:hypothetical protein BG011_001301 [Mortierella polycephala]
MGNMAKEDTPTIASTIDVDSQPILPWYKRIDRSKVILLFVVSLAQMLDVVNMAAVTIALPSILRDVHYEPNQLQWVVSSYALAYAAFLLVGGRMGDLFGHRRIFLIGTTWFSIWSLVCGFARDPIFMSVARGIQGSGAGFTIPSALALLTTTFPLGPERNFALSIFGGAACVGQTVGVLLGGIFDATIGWYWIFFVSTILSAIIVILGFFAISNSDNQSETPDKRIDYFGVFFFMAGIIMIIFYLSESISAGWASPKTLVPLVVGLVLLVIFIFWESRIEYPIMPFRIWKSRRFTSAVVIFMCVSASGNVMIFFSSLTFQNVLGYSPLVTAYCYIVHGAGLALGLYTITKLYPYIRTKFIMMIGWCFVIGSSALLTQISPGSTYWQFAFPALIINCLGISVTWMSSQVNAVADASNEDQGVVGGIFNVALQLGGPIGLAFGTILNQKYEDLDNGPEGLMNGYRAAFYTHGVISIVGFMATLILASNHDPIEFSGGTSEVKEEDKEKGLGNDISVVGEQQQQGDKSKGLNGSLTNSLAPTTVEETNRIFA